MAAGETFKASVICMLAGTGSAVVFDYGYVDLTPGGTAHLDMGTWAGTFQTAVQASLAAALPDGLTFKKYRFACVHSTAGHLGEIGYVYVTTPVTGSLSSTDALPAEIAISLKRSTGHASRRDRGRIFLGPVAADLRDSTNTDAPDLTNTSLVAARDTLIAPLTNGGTTLTPVILAHDGTYSGNTINRVDIGPIFVHRKSRRERAFV